MSRNPLLQIHSTLGNTQTQKINVSKVADTSTGDYFVAGVEGSNYPFIDV